MWRGLTFGAKDLKKNTNNKPAKIIHFFLPILFFRCDQKQECRMPVNSDVFGDPCPGTNKYVEVHFACAHRVLATTTKRPLPPWFLQGGADNLWSNPKLNPTSTTTLTSSAR